MKSNTENNMSKELIEQKIVAHKSLKLPQLNKRSLANQDWKQELEKLSNLLNSQMDKMNNILNKTK